MLGEPIARKEIANPNHTQDIRYSRFMKQDKLLELIKANPKRDII
jgi:hypothetical protein